jgi:two-component system OmpR family sensor kinase
MKITRYWPVLLPLALGLTAGLVLNLTQMSNPVLYLRADLGTVLFLAGLAFSTILSLILLVRRQLHQIEETITHEAAQDRRRFINLLDHELKNPLTAIMAGLANLSADQHSPALTSVETQVQRLSRLVADLRKLSDLETRPLELSRVDLAEMLQDLQQLARDRAGADRTIILSLPQAPWPLPEIITDRDLLFLAIHNVIDNAVKFTSPGDTIEIRASEDGRTITLEVADTGPGIPPEEVNQVWGELYRGQNARGIPGSGLGLALVQGILKRLDGRASIRSQTGKGTVISLNIPAGGVVTEQ